MSKKLSAGLRLSILISLFISGATAVFGAPPRAHHLFISGNTHQYVPATDIVKNPTTMRVGSTLRVWYTWADPDAGNTEVGTTYQWYRWELDGVTRNMIPGATGATYTLTTNEANKYISVEVTPRDNTNTAGTTREFKAFDIAGGNLNLVYLATVGNCGKADGSGVPTPGNVILNPNASLCSPRTLTWQVQYTGINWSAAGGLFPKVVINWNDNISETLDPGIFNTLTSTFDQGLFNDLDALTATKNDTINLTNILNQVWRVQRAHTYDYTIAGRTHSVVANERCTYTMITTWGVGASPCSAFGDQRQKFAVWDNEGNANLGTRDMNWVNSTGGFISTTTTPAETTDICPRDRTAIRVADASDFNCTPTGIVENPNVNNQARWVQFVYGTANTMTTGATPAESITIDGVNFTSAQLPVYGPILYIPATTLPTYPTPSAVTLNMQVPTTATVGQTMQVTMRTWNTCAPFDRIVADGGTNPTQGGANNVFQIYGSANIVGGPALGGGTSFFAHATPALTNYTLRVVSAPAAPTVTFTADHCDTDADNTFTFNTTHTVANSFLRWYDNAALTPPTEKTSTTSNTFNPITEGSPAMVKAATAETKNISYYVTEQWPQPAGTPAGTQGCLSPARTMTFNITDVTTPGTIDHPDEIMATQTVAICTGTNPPGFSNLTPAGGGNGAVYNYQWESSVTSALAGFNDIGSATLATYDPPALTQTTWFRRGVTSGFCGEVFSNVFEIRVDNPVTPGSINGTQTKCVSDDPTILGNVTGGGAGNGINYDYQWESSTTSAAGPYNTIALATGDSYDPPVLAQTTHFRRRVTSGVCALDGADAGSDPDNIAYTTPITVTIHQLNNPGSIGNAQIICNGGNPTALTSVTGASGGDGTNFAYQWQQASAVGGPFSDIGAATAATFDPPVLTATTFYRRRVRSPGPGTSTCPEVFSNVIEITVNPLPGGNVTGGGSICNGGTTPAPDIIFTFNAGSGPWDLVYSIDGVNQPVVNNTTSPYTITSPGVGVYRIVSINDNNNCSVATPHANITTTGLATVSFGGNAPQLDVAPAFVSNSTCLNGASTTNPMLTFSLTTLTAETGTYTLTYRVDGGANRTKTFQVNPNPGNGDVTAPLNFSDAEFDAVTPSPHTLTMLSIVSQNLCQTVMAINLSYTVHPFPVGASKTLTAVCGPATLNINPQTTSVDIAAGGNGVNSTFTWTAAYPAGLNGGAASGSNNITGTLTNVTGGSLSAVYTVTATSVTGSCAGPTTFTITQPVLPTPTIVAGQTKTICSGANVAYHIQLSPLDLPANTVFNWPDPDLGGPATAGSNVALGAAASFHINDVLTNVTGNPITVNYVVTPTAPSGGCPGPAQTIAITVNPAPVLVNPQTKTICSGDAVGYHIQLTPTDLPSNTTFSWPDPDAGGPATAGSAVALGGAATIHINDVLVNTSGSPQTVNYVVTPTAGSCGGTPRTIPIIVNPAPVLNTPQTKTICSGEAVNYRILLTPNNLPAGTLFTWPAPAMSAGGAQGSGRTAVPATDALHITDNLVNTGTSPITATYTITPTSGAGCPGTPRDVVVTINPLPTTNAILGPGTVCAGSNIILYQVTPNVGSTYTWTIDPLFQVFGGGTTNDFFVLLRFPTTGTANISVRETNSFPGKNCQGPLNTFPITVAGAPGTLDIDGPDPVCKGQTGVVYEVPLAIFDPLSTYTWTASGANIVSATSGQGLRQITVDFGLLSAASITVNETSISGCAGTPFTMNISVSDRPTMNSATTTTVCSGSAPSLVFSASLPSNFSWTVITVSGSIGGTLVGSNGTGNLSQVLTNTSGFAGTVTYRVTPTAIAAPNCAGPTQDVMVTVNPEPVLNLTNKTICSNQPAAYEIKLNPLNLPPGTTFSWAAPTMSAGVPQGTSGTLVPMGAAGTIHINNSFVNNGTAPITATYIITATSGLGCNSNQAAGSRTVVFTINPQPVGANDNTPLVCSQASPNYSLANNITTLGNGLVAGTTYTWQAVSNGNVTGESFAVPQSTAFITDNLRNITSSLQTVVYNVTATSALGCAGSTFQVSINVNPEPRGFNDTPAPVCSDVALSYSLATNISGGGNGLSAGTTYSWQAAVNPNVSGASTATQTTSTIADVLTNVTAIDQTVVYTVTPTSSNGCVGDNFTVTVTVRPEPVGTNSAASRCSDEVVNLTITTSPVSVASATFNITVTNNGLPLVAGTNSAGNNKLANELADDVWRNTTSAPVNVVYAIVPVSAAGCLGNSFSITVTINPEPIGVPQTITRCSDELVNVALGVTGASVAASSYNIAVNNGGLTYSGGSASAGNGKASNELADDRWTNTGLLPVDVIYTINPVSAAGCVGDAFIVTVTINPEPVGANSTAIRCSDEDVAVTLTTAGTSVAASTYNITTVSNGLTQSLGTVSAGTGKFANELADDRWTNIGLNPVDVVYTVTPVSAAGCLGNPFTVTITVRPEPSASNSNIARCSDELVNVTISTDLSSVAAATYNIAVASGGLAFSGTTASGGPAKLANELMDDRWTNTGLTPVNVVYTITPISLQNCAGNPFTITVSVRPEPVGANSNATACSDDALLLNLTTNAASVAAATYTIAVNPGGLVQSSGTNSAGSNKLANELADDVWRNTGLSPVNVVYTVTPISAAGCAGNDFTVTVAINPEPVGSNIATTVCANSQVNVPLTTNAASVAAATYNIAINPNGLVLAAGTPSGGTGKLANELVDDVWSNTGLGPVSVIYTITPVSAAGCLGDQFTVTATINPQPAGSNITATRCSDIAVGVTLTTSVTSVPASSYNITTVTGGLTQSAGSVSAGNGKAANELVDDVWRNTGMAPVDVVYTVRPVSAAGCVGDPFTVTITVNPEPVGANSTATKCSDEVLGINLTTNGTSVAAATYDITVTSNGLSLSAGTPSAGTGKLFGEIADDVWRNTGTAAVNVIYSVIPVSAAGCAGDAFTVTVTINPEPVGANSTASRCSDEVLGINITTNAASAAAVNYTIAVANGGLVQVLGTNSAGNNKLANEIADDVWRNTSNAAVDVVYTITPFSALGCAGDNFTITVTINPEPIGVLQTATRCSDDAVNVTLGTTGGSVAAASYNISVANGGLTLSGGIASAGTGKAANELADDRWTNTGLIPVNVIYTVNPVSAAGCVGDQFTVTITVNPEPVGANSSVTRCSDDLVNVTLSTSGTSVASATYDIATAAGGLTQSAGTVSAGTGKLANELADDRWTNTGLNPVNVVYTITPISAAGCSGNTFTVTVTVRPEPSAVSSSVSRCSDDLVNVTITTDIASVAAATYDISIVAGGLAFSGTTPSGGTGKLANELMDDRWTNTGLAPVNVVYTITPISSLSCAGDPFTITVTVRPEPVGANSTSTVCSDSPVGTNLTTNAASVAAATYNIAVNPGGLVQSAGTNSVGSNKLFNEIADDVWRNTGLTPVPVVYTITPVSAAGCAGNDFTITVTINPEPVGSNSTTTVCGNDPVTVTLSTNPASVAASTYTIAVNPNGLVLASGTPSAGTGKAANEIADDVWANTGLGPVSVIYTITPVSAANCPGDPFTVTATINPQPVGSNMTVTRCSDDAVAVSLTTSVTAVAASSYNITTVNNGLVQSAGTVSAGNTKAANELNDDVWRNTGMVPVDVVYTIRPVSAAGCIGDAFTVTVTVNPEPVGANSTATKCSDEVLAITLATSGTSVAAATYTIAVANGGLTLSAGTASAGSGKLANEIADDVWRNTGLNPVDVVYTITPVSALSCNGDPFTVTVTINPEPVGANSTATKCSDEVLAINITTSPLAVAAASYTIGVANGGLSQVGGTASGGAGKTAAEIADDVWRNTTGAPVNVIYTITPITASNCSGDNFTITVTINPEPVGVAQAPTRCSDELVAVTLGVAGGSVAAATYTISINANGLPFSGTTASSGAGKLANELADDRWTNTGLTPVNVEYTITPVSAAGCNGDNFMVTVTVNPEPVGANSSATRCSDDLVGVLLSTSATAVAADSYNISITANGLTFSGATPSAGIGKLSNELMDDRWTNDGLIPVNVIYQITPVSAAGCQGDPFTVNVTVRPEPVGFDSNLTICSDQTTSFTLSTNGSSVAATTYNISIANGGLIQSAGSPSGGSLKLANEIFADAWTNTGMLPVDVVYTIIPVSAAPGLCQGNPFLVTVTVTPEPVGAPLTVDLCSDETTAFTLTTSGTSVAADTYNITINSGGLTASAGTPASGTGFTAAEIADDAWHNITVAPVNVTYTIIPVSADGCLGNQFVLTFRINPEPVGQDEIVSDCSTTLSYNIQNDNINAHGNGLPSVFTYVVTSSDEGAVPTPAILDRPLPGNSDPITDSFVNTSGAAVVVTYTITPYNAATPACAGTPFIYQVTISPKPVGVDAIKAAVCSDVGFDFNPQADLSPSVASTFTWTVTYDAGLTVGVGKFPRTGNITETLTNTTNLVLNAEYEVTPTATGSSCVGDPFTITVPISPEPVVASTLDATRCSDIAYGVNLATTAASAVAANYDIASVVDPGLTGAATSGSTLANNALFADVFTNQTATQLRVTYTVTPRAGTGCLGDPLAVVFRVNPEPVLDPTIAPPAVCSNNVDNPSVINVVMGTNGSSINAQLYRLDLVEYKYVGGPTFGGAPAGLTVGAGNRAVGTSSNANVIRTDSYNNVADLGVVVKYTITPISPSPQSCLGDARDYEVVINPEPELDPALSPTPVCSEIITGVTLSVNPGPPPSVAAATYIIRGIQFPGLTPGGSNALTGGGKLANAIFNDTYINTTSGPLPAVYTIAPVSGAGCIGVDDDITLNINPAPNLQVAAAITCNDLASGIIFAGDPSAIAPVTYNVVSINVDPDLTPNGANVVTPATGVAANYVQADRYVNSTTTTQIVEYRVRPVSAAACVGPQETVLLTVEPLIVAVPTPALQTVCGDGLVQTAVTLSSPSVPSAGSISFNYTAVPSSAQVSGFSPVANSLPNPHVIADFLVNNSDIVRQVVYNVRPIAPGARNGGGCQGNIVPVTITVEPKPKLPLVGTKTICEDDAVNIALNSPTVPSTGAASVFFDLVSTPTGNVTNFSPTGTSFTNGQTLADVLRNADPVNATVEYKFTPKFGTCVGSEVTLMVTVSPRPNITPIGPFDICSGEVFGPIGITVDTESASPGSTFINWTVVADPDITGESPGAGNSFSQVLFNRTANAKTLNYTLSARNVANVPACNGSPVPVTVTVFPEPRLVGLPTSVNVCNNETKSITLNSTAPTLSSYTWVVDNNANPDLPVIGAGGGPVITQTFVNNGESLGNYLYTVTPKVIIPSNSKECVGIDGNMVINVAPSITGSLTVNGEDESFICKGQNQTLTFQFGGLALFEYTYNDGATTSTVTKVGPFDTEIVKPLVTTTYQLLSVKDGYGCLHNPAGQSVTVNVGSTAAAFAIDGPAIHCSPYQVKFKHDQVAGTNYNWRWNDGIADSSYLAGTNVAPQTILHTFFNPAPRGNVKFDVFLEASLDDNYPNGCRTTTKQSVTIYPTVAPAVFANKDIICSDETVTFTNSSQGVGSNKWFYRVQGTNTEIEPKTTINASFKIPNTSTSNPIVYEVVFQSTNGNCPAPDVVTPITVYRGVDANFSNTTPTVFQGGHSFATFTNTSAPVDGSDFRYEWDFGLNGNPGTSQGTGPFNLDYTTPGPKEVVMLATNIAAEAAGLTCADEIRKTINIVVPPLEARFVAVPLQACFPTDITITENTSTGDKFTWRVLDAAGTAAQSNAELPVFKIPAPGRYTVELVTSNSFTGDQKTATQDVVVYDLPMASFDVRPGVVYVPDTELQTYNFSDGATTYTWDFGDGTVIDDVKEPVHKYQIEGVYDVMLIAKNDHGNDVVCVDSLTRKVTAKQGGVSRVPNAFTPNPNGPVGRTPGSNTFNDVFLPQVRGAVEFNMQIFDRWGNLIFESISATEGWDGYDRNGKLMPAGVYVYKLTLLLSDGQRTTQVGDITMIR